MIQKQKVDVQALNFRQTIEGMPLVFDATAAGDMKATIQFNATGAQTGVYHLRIESGNCSFHKGPAARADLTIQTPSEVWLKINSGELSGEDALVQGLYTVSGDANLLIRMQELFKTPEGFSVEVSSQRPAGPLPLRGMHWMAVLFVPWTFFFFTYEIHAVSYWISLGLPALIMLLIVIYRSIFNRPLWTEITSLIFFVLLGIVGPLLKVPLFIDWGSIIALLVIGLMWLISLVPPFMLPLTAEYSKWNFTPGLWANSMFIQPNMAITLMWGWQFVISAGLGIAARTILWLYLPLTALRLLLLLPAFIFSARYQKGAAGRSFADIDRTMHTLRVWSSIGVVTAVALLLLLFIAFV